MNTSSQETITLKNGSPKVKRKTDLSGLFILPYALLFAIFVVLLIVITILLSFTYYDTVNFPIFMGISNYITLITQDEDFMQYAIPTTVRYALIVGPGGYALSFLMAWILAQLPHKIRNISAIILYSPALTSSVLMTVVWRVAFSGDNRGYLNNFLLRIGVINAPVQWLQDPKTVMLIMIIVGLWSSMGIGFLAILSGILNINKEIYEAAYVDGLKNRWQEIFYITIPSMKPQMLFSGVMAIVSTFNAVGIASALTLSFPPPQMAGWLIVDHMNDYGFSKFEMGYASAIAVVLLSIVLLFSLVIKKLFGGKDE